MRAILGSFDAAGARVSWRADVSSEQRAERCEVIDCHTWRSGLRPPTVQ
jgi:hypothetical protein